MNEDKIIQKLIDIDAKLDGLVAKSEFNLFKEEYFNGQDQVLSILKRLDEERVFTIEWIRRIETDVAKIKEVLKIA